MSILNKVIALAIIAIVMVLSVLIYWNQHLYFEAEKIGDTEKRIEVLERASKIYPWNDLVYYELGKTYLNLGMSSLGEQGRSSIHFQKSESYFIHSLKINPTSYFGHFYLAQSFQNMSFGSPSLEEDAQIEYKKSSYLAGENTEIFYEIGRVFLSRWQVLSEEDRDFTTEILKKIIDGGERERLRSLFYLWEINVKDYEVMDEVLPEDPQVYKDFADFLGDRSLSLDARQKYLAQAETLEFQRARDASDDGEYALFYYRLKEAQNYFKSCQNILKRIHFYQDLLGYQNLIDKSEYSRLWTLTLLNLFKSNLEEGKGLKDVSGYLWEYLERENRKAAYEELENYLRRKGLIGERENPSFNDLDRLSLEFFLYFQEGRFEDIINKGKDLSQRIVALPEGKEDRYIKILEIVGESYKKVDYIYYSNDLYKDALRRDPRNLELLVKLRQNYERLNSEKEIEEVDRRIEEIVSPHEVGVDRMVNRRQTFRRKMILDGRDLILGLEFEKGDNSRAPLISIFFNGRVIWEGYLEGDMVSIPVESKIGENVVEVVPVNRGVELVRIMYE
jgi:hypothetical protein